MDISEEPEPKQPIREKETGPQNDVAELKEPLKKKRVILVRDPIYVANPGDNTCCKCRGGRLTNPLQKLTPATQIGGQICDRTLA